MELSDNIASLSVSGESHIASRSVSGDEVLVANRNESSDESHDDGDPDSDERKPLCEHQPCGGVICEVGCLRLSDYDRLQGWCFPHYKQHCDTMNWDSDLSYCLNVRCDEMDISVVDRRKLDPFNLKKLTGITDHDGHFRKSSMEVSSSSDDEPERVKPAEKRVAPKSIIAGRTRSAKVRHDHEESLESEGASLEERSEESSDHDDPMIIDHAQDSEQEDPALDSDSYSSASPELDSESDE